MQGRVGDGRYTLSSRKGAGGVGEVWSARDERLDRDVAVKILRGTDSRTVARFRQEALATASLVHPNIVHVSDYFVEQGVPYIVMELLGGVSLSDLVHALGPLDPRRAVKLAIDVCSALEFAHERGVIHRDIKPGNIQVVPDPEGTEHASVLDFGIAKIADATTLTEAGAAIGTPCFMAPEQIAGAPADARMDVYATGVTLYYALSAELPFSGATPHGVISAVMTGRARALGALRPDLDPELCAIVERATAHAPEQRFASARELRTALDTWLRATSRSSRQLPSSALPGAFSAHGPTTTNLVAQALPTVVEPAILRRRRRALWFAAIGSSLLASAVLVGGAIVLRSNANKPELAAPIDTKPLPTAPSASVTELVPIPIPTPPTPPENTAPVVPPAPRTVPAGPATCPRPRWSCGGRCVDLESDRAHCGSCSKACSADQACVNGACSKCPIGVGFSLCDGRCIQTFSDPNNCGTCSRKCPWGRCQAGRCS